MSLKVKFEDQLWTNLSEGEYLYDNTIEDCGPPFSGLKNPEQSALAMSIHPGWLKLMDELEIGDIVTTHTGALGVVTKVYEDRISLLGMIKYEVLIGNEKETFFSINLKKVGNE